MVRDSVSAAEGKIMNRLAKKMRKRLLPVSTTTQKVDKAVKKSMNKMKIKPEYKLASNTTLADNVQIYGVGLKYDGVTSTNGWVNTGNVASGIANPIIPNVQQGLTQSGRIGNQIVPKKCLLRYSLYANPSTQTDSTGGNSNPFICLPFYVRVVVYRHRYAIDDFSQNAILESGNANFDISGNPESLFIGYNKDEYIIAHSKTHYMQPQRHALSGSNFTGQLQDQKAKTNVMSKKLTIPLPKVLKYNDNGSQPTNAGWFIGVAVVNSDGSYVTNVQARVKLIAETYMTYTDV